ncbi:hypothetical protein HOY80DRAFT_987770 [Tuber brumale]|nr:hypothetical protein HOY80DRAFT_987770 [Tuber brumale]
MMLSFPITFALVAHSFFLVSRIRWKGRRSVCPSVIIPVCGTYCASIIQYSYCAVHGVFARLWEWRCPIDRGAGVEIVFLVIFVLTN